jgi:hypothetical protein
MVKDLRLFLHLSIASLSLMLMNCKQECVGLEDTVTKLKSAQLQSVRYLGNDTLLFETNAGIIRLIGGGIQSFYNSKTPNTNCDATQKFEGKLIIFSDSTGSQNILSHQITVSSVDTNEANIAFYFQNIVYEFPVRYLNIPGLLKSYTFDSIAFSGVYAARNNNLDSFYYSKNSGIIRFTRNGKIYQTLRQ